MSALAQWDSELRKMLTHIHKQRSTGQRNRYRIATDLCVYYANGTVTFGEFPEWAVVDIQGEVQSWLKKYKAVPPRILNLWKQHCTA